MKYNIIIIIIPRISSLLDSYQTAAELLEETNKESLENPILEVLWSAGRPQERTLIPDPDGGWTGPCGHGWSCPKAHCQACAATGSACLLPLCSAAKQGSQGEVFLL